MESSWWRIPPPLERASATTASGNTENRYVEKPTLADGPGKIRMRCFVATQVWVRYPHDSHEGIDEVVGITLASCSGRE